MILRAAESHLTLMLITLAILIGSVGIMTQQIGFLASSHQMNFIPADVNLEDDIAILLAAYGVFLEHHRYLLDMIYKDGLLPAIEAFDDYSHQFGVLMIPVAFLLVALDLLILALST